MRPGSVVGDRFEIEREAGSGGMSTVFRAIDRQDGQRIALKVLHAAEAIDEERFAREAAVLAELDSPAIIRYIAHGSGRGLHWLATEWLDGEDLFTRLAKGGIAVAESVALARRIAEALALAHEKEIIHRDIKPSNLFLERGEIDRVKLIDFGVVRRARDGLRLTGTGTLIGTPGYMSPEQASGTHELDASADVFSLGCVLFECLTGRPTFAGEHAMAVLTRVLNEDAPRASEYRPDLSPALDGLVARMLSRSPAARPRDAAAVARELGELGEQRGGAPGRLAPRPPALSIAEQRLVTVVLIALDAEAESIRASRSEIADATVREVVESHGGSIEPLAEGTLVVTQPRRGAAADRAATAASCALALREALPSAPIAMASGRGVVLAGHLAGEVLERGVRALARAVDARIRLDQVTATLLRGRFEVRGERGSLALHGLDDGGTPPPGVLGKTLPWLGRDRELATLDAIFQAVRSEPIARAVLVTGGPGTGKSRLQRELVGRLAAEGDGALVLSTRGDPLRARPIFATLAEAVKSAAGVTRADTPAERRQKLGQRLARHLAPERAAGVESRLALLVDGEPWRTAPSERPAESIGAAFREWLAAEVAARVVVLVIDDLHEADLLTIKLVDDALGQLRDHPFMVLALARPEVHAHLPRLWSDRALQELRLGGLARKACEKLACAALGEEAPPERVAAIVDACDGNPSYLEELAAAPATVELPEAIFGMVQASFDPLTPEARRALRAASVLGERFWSEALRELLPSATTPAVDEWLEELCARDMLHRSGSTDPVWGLEYAFAGPLVHRAARASLTDEDRALGERLAKSWADRAQAIVRKF